MYITVYMCVMDNLQMDTMQSLDIHLRYNIMLWFGRMEGHYPDVKLFTTVIKTCAMCGASTPGHFRADAEILRAPHCSQKGFSEIEPIH